MLSLRERKAEMKRTEHRALPSRADDVDAFFAGYPEAVRETASAARALIRGTFPDANEMLDRSARVVGYGFGTRYTETICTIILSKSGVKLGIVDGAMLPDPYRLLEGSGKRHKYVVLSTPADVRKRGVLPLLEAAAADRRSRRKK